MEKRILKSMVDYVLSQTCPEHLEENEFDDVYTKISNYARFLSMPLTLGMFIPCDEDGNVLNEPKMDSNKYYHDKSKGLFDRVMFNKDLEVYEESLDNVIFEGFEVKQIKGANNFYIWISNRENILVWSKDENKFQNKEIIIEDIISYDLIITQSAITKYQI